MRVDSNAFVLSKCPIEHDCSSFSTDARKTNKLFHRPGHSPVIFFKKYATELLNVSGFGTECAARMNEAFEFPTREKKVIVCRTAVCKERWSGAIHLCIRATRRENRRNKEIERSAPFKKRFRRTVEPLELLQNTLCGQSIVHGTSMELLEQQSTTPQI